LLLGDNSAHDSDTLRYFQQRCKDIYVSREAYNSRGEMYIGHGRLFVRLSLAAFPHYYTDSDVSWRNGRGSL